MNSSLPDGFIRRIRKYPEPVQAYLSQPLGDAAFADALLVLHGDVVDGVKKAGDHEAVLVDTFLSRLVVSNKFQMRVDSLIAFFGGDQAGNKAGFDLAGAHGFLKVLADPDKPYVHKIREVVRAKEPLLPFQANFAIVLRFTKIWRIFSDRQEKIEDALAGMIRSAAQEGTVEFLNTVMGALGQDLRFAVKAAGGNRDTSGAGRANAACSALIGQILSRQGAMVHLDQAANHALEKLRHMMPGNEAVLTLSPPRKLRVILDTPVTAEDKACWQSVKGQGLIGSVEANPPKNPQEEGDMTVLLPAQARLSPVLLAVLPCLHAVPKVMRAVIEQRGNPGSWAEHIVGLDDTQSHFEDVGYIWLGVQDKAAIAAFKDRVAMPALAIALAQTQGGRTPLPATLQNIETCYALIVRLEDGPDLAGYINSDCCVVFENLAALQAMLEKDKGAILQKPVVLIDAQTPVDEDYIVTSVQAFWAFGGRYVVGFADPGYQGMTGNLSPTQNADSDHLCRVVFTALATVPLTLLHSDGAALSQQIVGSKARGYLISPDTLAVQVAHHGMQKLGDPAYLRRLINVNKLTQEDREALFLAGKVTTHYLLRHEPTEHWPVEHLMRPLMQSHHRMRSQIAQFTRRPDPALAALVLAGVHENFDLATEMHAELGNFAVVLATHQFIFLQLDEESTKYFFGLARQLDRADEVALALAIYADDICRLKSRNTISLFELLASCLPPGQLSVILAAVSMSNIEGGGRFLYRMAECLRRYGDDLTQMMFLTALIARSAPVLEEADFLRNFEGLLIAPDLITIKKMVGQDILDDIALSVRYVDAFERAVVQRDRSTLLALAKDTESAGEIDVLKWFELLRGFSNELLELEIPVSALSMPDVIRLHQRKLAAVLFSDPVVLRALDAGGFIQSDLDIDAVAQNFLGNNDALNAVIARQFYKSGVTPYLIKGNTTEEVFAYAAETTKPAKPAKRKASGPLVSVIMSAFNPDLGLMRQCVESIAAQSHSNIEMFVVDDASAPQNGSGIRALCDKYNFIHYHRMAQNSGPYIGRNYALSQAKGTYFAIHDADDWAHPDRFAKQIEAFEADAHLQVITTPHIRIDRYGRVQMEAGFTIFGDGPMTSMFRREIFDEIGGFSRTRSRGDIEMRERIRAYYGSHSLRELAVPAALCLADSATLSQQVKLKKRHDLRIFRHHIDGQVALRHARRDKINLADGCRPLVPFALRPPLAEDPS